MVRSLGLLAIRPRSIIGLVCALILIGTVITWFVWPQRASAQQCSAPRAWISGETPGGDGLIHVSVNYSGGSTAPTSTMKGLIEEAIAAWNAHQCRTGVVFEETTIIGSDLEFKYTTNEILTGSCAAYGPATDTIYHGPPPSKPA